MLLLKNMLLVSNMVAHLVGCVDFELLGLLWILWMLIDCSCGILYHSDKGSGFDLADEGSSSFAHFRGTCPGFCYVYSNCKPHKDT